MLRFDKCKIILLFILCSVILELLCSNYRIIFSLFDEPQLKEKDLSNSIKYIINDDSSTILISDISEQINSISFTTLYNEGNTEKSSPVYVTLKVVEQSNSLNFNTLKNTQIAMGNHLERETKLYISPTGKVHSILLSFSNVKQEFTVENIKINTHNTFSFSVVRGLVFFLLLFVTYIGKKYNTWKLYYNHKNPNHRLVVILLIFISLLISLFVDQFLMKSQSPIEYPLNNAIESYNPYIQQFDALMKGQLFLDIQPSKELLALDNPYDPSLRKGIDSLWDRVFYEGKYYTYYGIGPIIVIYYPCYYLFHKLPGESDVMLIFSMITVVFFILTIVKLMQFFSLKVSLSLLVWGTISALFASNIFLLQRGYKAFYYLSYLSGMAFLCIYIFLLLCAITESKLKKRNLKLFLAGCAFSMIILSRINMGIMGVMVTLPIIYYQMIKNKKRERVGSLVMLLIPISVTVIITLTLNYIRFGNPLEFGTTYQLTVSNIAYNQISIEKLFPSIYHYFLQGFQITKYFPYLTLSKVNFENYGQYIYIDSNMGLLSIPLMWSLLAGVLLIRSKKMNREMRILLSTCLLAICIMAFLDFCLAGVIYRYIADISLISSFTSIFILWGINGRWINQKVHLASKWLMIFSIIICAGILLDSTNQNLSSYHPEVLISIRDFFCFWN